MNHSFSILHHELLNLPTNSGVPKMFLNSTPSLILCAKPKSISLIRGSWMLLSSSMMFSGWKTIKLPFKTINSHPNFKHPNSQKLQSIGSCFHWHYGCHCLTVQCWTCHSLFSLFYYIIILHDQYFLIKKLREKNYLNFKIKWETFVFSREKINRKLKLFTKFTKHIIAW